LIVANYVDFDSATALRGGAAFVHVEGRSGDVRATRAAWAKNILYHNLGNGV